MLRIYNFIAIAFLILDVAVFPSACNQCKSSRPHYYDPYRHTMLIMVNEYDENNQLVPITTIDCSVGNTKWLKGDILTQEVLYEEIDQLVRDYYNDGQTYEYVIRNVYNYYGTEVYLPHTLSDNDLVEHFQGCYDVFVFSVIVEKVNISINE